MTHAEIYDRLKNLDMPLTEEEWDGLIRLIDELSPGFRVNILIGDDTKASK